MDFPLFLIFKDGDEVKMKQKALGLVLFFCISFAEFMFADELEVTFSTKTVPGSQYGPSNVVVAWIEDTNGIFIKTLGRWGTTRAPDLVFWIIASGFDADAVMGATRSTYGNLNVSWDFKDKSGVEVPSGTYVLKLELTENDAPPLNGAHTNLGSFQFQKNGVSGVKTLAGGGFDLVKMVYTASESSARVQAGPDHTLVLPFKSELFGKVDGKSTLPSGYTAIWSQISGPGLVTFSQENQLYSLASFDSVGQYVLKLESGLPAQIGEDLLEVHVVDSGVPNTAPVVGVKDNLSGWVGQGIQLEAEAADDGQPNNQIETSWEKFSGPGVLSLSDSSDMASSASFDKPGIYILEFVASDGELESREKVTINVSEQSENVSNGESVVGNARATTESLERTDHGGCFLNF